jgi:hypothetical protein
MNFRDLLKKAANFGPMKTVLTGLLVFAWLVLAVSQLMTDLRALYDRVSPHLHL